MSTTGQPPEWATGPAEEMAPGLWRLPMPIPGHTLGGVCAYLIRDHDGYVLVDAGMDIPACQEVFDAHLAALGVPITALHTIVVTHGHPDHGGQAPPLRERSGAPIWLSRRDAALVDPVHPIGDADLDGLVAWLGRYGFPPEEAEEARQAVQRGLGRTATYTPDRLIEDGDELEVGPYRFTVVATPGHTPGHVCLYEPAHCFALTGDHLFGMAAPNVRLMPFSGRDIMRQYVGSLRRIAELRPERALPGHGEPFERVAERVADVVEHQLKRRDRLKSLMTDRPQTPYQLAQVVWGPGSGRRSWEQFNGRLRRNAGLTLAGHLEWLTLDGEIARYEEETVSFARAR